MPKSLPKRSAKYATIKRIKKIKITTAKVIKNGCQKDLRINLSIFFIILWNIKNARDSDWNTSIVRFIKNAKLGKFDFWKSLKFLNCPQFLLTCKLNLPRVQLIHLHRYSLNNQQFWDTLNPWGHLHPFWIQDNYGLFPPN